MKRLRILYSMLLVAFASLPLPTVAATDSITLSVPGMTCSTCPIVVKQSLVRLTGVIDVRFDLGNQEATVVFDSKRIRPEALVKATTNSGFPSTVKASIP